MNFFSLLKVELNRIFHSNIMWITGILTILCPLTGYGLINFLGASTVSDKLIAGPAFNGAVGGAVLFSLFMLMEHDNIRKNKTEVLMNSIISPVKLNIARFISILITASFITIVTSILYLPYTLIKMGSIFDSFTYFSAYLNLMLGSILLAVLAASILYQIFNRADISFIAFIVFMGMSYSQWVSGNYILRWVNPKIPDLSDDFSNSMVFRLMGYNRLFWMLILGGLWLISILFIRRYGKGLLGSFAVGLRKVYLVIMSFILLISGYFVYVNQPYVDHSPKTCSFTQIMPSAKLLLNNTKLDVSINTNSGNLFGKVIYSVDNISGKEQKSKVEINPGYEIKSIVANGNSISFRDLKNDNNSVKDITFTMPKNHKIILAMEYSGAPKIWSYLSDYLLEPSCIDTKYVQLGHGELYPSLDEIDSIKGSEISCRINLPSQLTPITTGYTLKLISKNTNGTKTWYAHDDGSYIMLLAGNYIKKVFRASDIPIEFYYSKGLENNMKKLSADKIIKYAINYNSNRYGKLSYATPNKPMKIIEATILGGGGVKRNISFMPESAFSDENLKDTEKGPSKAEVLAHEITHQWWNSQIYDTNDSDWTQEGVTVYTTYRMMEEKYGKAYAEKNYINKWKYNYEKNKLGFYNRHPEYLKFLSDDIIANIESSNAAVNWYAALPLKIYKASKLVGGEKNMDKILSEIYHKFGTDACPYATYNDFLKACKLRKESLKLD